MTQHILEEDTVADKKAMRSLFAVVAGFVVATAIMAIAIGATMS